jgi:STE24 endopeptidase
LIFCANIVILRKPLRANHLTLCGVMASEGLTDPQHGQPERAKAYNRIRLATGIANSILSFGLLVALVGTNAARDIGAWSRSVAAHDYGALILFVVCVGALQTLLTLPLGWYSGFYVEHTYGLSNQSLGRWAWEKLKGAMVGLPLLLAVLCTVFFCLRTYGSLWWLPGSIMLTFLSVVLARLGPILIMPLFYRFTPLVDGPLKERILRLCEGAGVRIEGVFSFDLSKNTKKANAAFTGIGRAKRIILGDTLVREFTEEEIETVFAHELGHYRFGHIRTGILIGTISTFVGMFIAARLYASLAQALGFASIADIAALPLLAITLTLYSLVVSPIGNLLSRRHERQADAFAVRSTGKRDAFVSALRKLSRMNLADPDPHPLVEFLFYSHPPIPKRIRAIETVQHERESAWARYDSSPRRLSRY